MSPTKSSKNRFSEFLDKFRRGDLKSDPKEDDSKKKLDPKQKKLRRSYLRLYAKRLWPHRNLVLLLTVLALVVAGLELIQPLFARYIFDDVLLAENFEGSKIAHLNFIGAIFLGIVIFARIIGITRSWFQRLLNVRVILTLRRALFERMLNLPLDKLSDMKVGGIISRLTDDINKTTGLLQMAVISPGVAVIRLLLAMGILLFINWKLALTALGVIPPIMLLSMIAIRRIRPIYRAIRKDVSYVDGRVGEAFQGIRAVRAFSGEKREEQEYNIGHNAITRMRMYAAKREIIVWSAWGFLISMISVVITWAGGYWYIQGQATIGDITAFQVYILMLLNPVWQIVESMTELQRSLAAMERVFEVLETPADKPDRPNAIETSGVVEEIQFENVSFAYNDSDSEGRSDNQNDRDANDGPTHDSHPIRPGDNLIRSNSGADAESASDGATSNDPINVIKEFSLTVRGGSVVALVGRSGAGKTTLTDLVARFYDPTKGRILFNGIDLRDYQLGSYREMLGVVQQEVFLFDGTVAENIAYAQRHASMDRIVEAARQANAHDFISELPDGYNSIIGERGVKLSGGQRQRLSIARALLADPKILILDEATSNLDTESEQLIQQSIQQLLKDRTTFIIAHRLSTITHADQIVVIDDGALVELGTHDELIKRDQVYAQMIRRQSESMSLD